MKLGFCLFKYFPFGGLQRDFYGIASECVARGHQVDVYTMHWQGDIPKGFNVILIKPRGWMNHYRYWDFSKKVKKLLLQQRYDLVIGFNKMPYLDVYYAADQCYATRAHNRRHWLYRCGGRYRYFMQLESAVFGNNANTKILYLSKRQKNDICEYYHTDPHRLHVLPPWIAKNRLVSDDSAQVRYQVRQEFAVSEGQIMLLMIGSGFKTKGLDRALLAIAALPKPVRYRVRFFVIGQDKATAYIRLARRLGIIEQVHILGGRSDVPRFLFAADCLIHPARNEAAGIVLLEAVVAGLPVLTTDVCGYAPYIQEAKLGMVLPSPFEQSMLNQRLLDMLSTLSRNVYIQRAMKYNAQHAFSEMPQKAVDYLEAVAPHVYHHYQKQLFVRADLAKQWAPDKIFEQVFGLCGTVYRELDGRRTLRFEVHGKAYFVKLHCGVGWREIFKNILQGRLPVVGAKQEWLAIKRLRQLGIETMQWVAYGSRGYNPATQQSFIITEALPDTVSLEQFCHNWPHQPPPPTLKKALLTRIAHVAKTLHQHGLNHRDFYICHFLLNIKSITPHNHYQDLQLFLIDLHRMQQRRQTPSRWVIKDIGSLYYSVMDIGLTQRDIFRFLKIYFNQPLRKILSERKDFLQAVQKRANALYRNPCQDDVLIA